jgi:hypothetical protein
MSQSTFTELDTGAYYAPMSIAGGIALLRSRGVAISRASIYRWNSDLVAEGRVPLFHQPSGTRGRVFIVPAEVESFIRSRCSDQTPDQVAD